MASTAASAGKNSRTRREAISNETDLQANGSGKPELSGDESEAMRQGVVKNRVLIIVENQAVPFDRRVWREACSLRENEYDVTVLCPRRKGSTKGYEVINGVRIYRHPSPAEGSTPMGYLWEYGWALFWEFWYTLRA